MPDDTDGVHLSQHCGPVKGPMLYLSLQISRARASPGAGCQALSMQKGFPLSFLSCKGGPLGGCIQLGSEKSHQDKILSPISTYRHLTDQC